MTARDEVRKEIFGLVLDACTKYRADQDPHMVSWARGGYRNDVPTLCPRCESLIDIMTEKLWALHVEAGAEQ